MTKRVNPFDHRRPRRLIGERLRSWLKCPIGCKGAMLRPVGPYREHWDKRRSAPGVTVRLECDACGLRFSVRVADAALARQNMLKNDCDQLRAMGDSDFVANELAWREEAIRSAKDTEALASMRPSDWPDERRRKVGHYRSLRAMLRLLAEIEGPITFDTAAAAWEVDLMTAIERVSDLYSARYLEHVENESSATPTQYALTRRGVDLAHA